MQTGIAVTAASTLSGWRTAAALAPPAFVAFLLLRVSGVPIQHKMGEKRYGSDPAYVAYRKNTPVLIPYIY